MRHYVAAIAACAGLASCSPGSDIPAAEHGIGAFHAQLNAGSFEQIYDASGPELKAAATKDEFVKILNAVHSKLGPFTNGKAIGWNDNVTTSGHYVTISYKASYRKGAADENFVYRIEGSQAALVGYHINSNALLFG